MPYTQQELEAFQQDFARRRQRQVVVGGLTVIGFLVVVLLARRRLYEFPLVLLWLAMVAGILVFSRQNWRCPACDRYLGKYPGRFCRNCGVPLRGDPLA